MPQKTIIRLGITVLVVGIIILIHWRRNQWNAPVVSIADVAAWTELTPEESIFHQMGSGNANNRKFVSADGHSEAVFRPNDSGEPPELVTDPINLGTYNFFGPRLLYGIPHTIFDVLPYFILGNSPADIFTTARFTALFTR